MIIIFSCFSYLHCCIRIRLSIHLLHLRSKRTTKRPIIPAIQNFHPNKYAVIIAARNEELVIGQLIKSIKNQKYPEHLIDIFVVADEASRENTAQVAAKAGAIVRERFNKA